MKKFWILFMILGGLLWIASGESFGQKKKKDKEKPKKEEEPVLVIGEAAASADNSGLNAEAEFSFVDGMKYYILEDYVKALENFQKALALASGNTAAIQYKISQTYLQLGNTAQAAFFAKEALTQDGTNRYYYTLSAKIQEHQHKYPEAIKTYEELIAKMKKTDEYYYDIAALYLKQDNYLKALETYDKLEKILGINETVIYQKQKIYLKTNQIDKATAEGEKLVNFAPGEPKYLVSLTELMIANNRADKAQPILEEAVRNNTADPRIYLLLAKIYRSKGDNPKATQYLKTAFAGVDLDSDEKINTLIELMKGNEANTNLPEFSELAEIIVKIHPEKAKAYAFYADLLLLRKDHKNALENYLKAIRLDNSHNEIWQRILGLEAEVMALDSIIQHSAQALEIFPNQALFWYYNGVGHLGKKHYQEAVEALEEGKRMAFNNPQMLADFHIRLGDAYNALKQYTESDAAYEAVLKSKPNEAMALNNYSYYLALRKERLDYAKTLAERLVENNPENATYLDTYAWVLYTTKDYLKARKFLEKALISSNSGTILEHYGDVLFKLGEKEKALEQWQKAKKNGGASAYIDRKIMEKKLVD